MWPRVFLEIVPDPGQQGAVAVRAFAAPPFVVSPTVRGEPVEPPFDKLRANGFILRGGVQVHGSSSQPLSSGRCAGGARRGWVTAKVG